MLRACPPLYANYITAQGQFRFKRIQQFRRFFAQAIGASFSQAEVALATNITPETVVAHDLALLRFAASAALMRRAAYKNASACSSGVMRTPTPVANVTIDRRSPSNSCGGISELT